MHKSLFDLTEETAVVVGGTGALGGAMAMALATAGARVAVVGRNEIAGRERVKELEEAGSKALFHSADVMEKTQLERARDEIESKLGAISILVNAAGGNVGPATLQPGQEIADLPEEAWRRVFDINLVGGILLPCQVFGAPMLQRERGSVINIASMSGMTPLSRVVAYSAAKAAVLNLTQFLAREWATRGVRVNAISPGFFPAEQNKKLLFNEDGTYTERGGQIIDHTPMGRFGVAKELGGAVVYLAAGAASGFTTGHNLVVDGGFSATSI